MCCRYITDPQLLFSSIMHASSVTNPSRSGNPPSPTEVSFGLPSGTRAPASTASNALPPFESIFQASALASTPKSQVEITIGLLACILPAIATEVTGNAAAPKADNFRNSLRVLIGLYVL